eukprot:4736991-Amphidinium_carterae.1
MMLSSQLERWTDGAIEDTQKTAHKGIAHKAIYPKPEIPKRSKNALSALEGMETCFKDVLSGRTRKNNTGIA